MTRLWSIAYIYGPQFQPPRQDHPCPLRSSTGRCSRPPSPRSRSAQPRPRAPRAPTTSDSSSAATRPRSTGRATRAAVASTSATAASAARRSAPAPARARVVHRPRPVRRPGRDRPLRRCPRQWRREPRRGRREPSPDHADRPAGGAPMTRTQRWTLTVVCAATAMLMLDIAVVNTALSAIAADLDTGLAGLQWTVDAYTLTLAATVITAGLARRPLRPPPAVRRRSGPVHRDVAAVRRVAVDHHAQRLARGAGPRRGGHVRGLAGRPLERVPADRRADEGARRLRRDDGRVVRDRAAGRRRAHVRPRLALDLPDQPPARPGLPLDRAPLRGRVAGPARAAGRPRRPGHADRRAVPARASRCCAATTWAGRPDDRRRVRGRRRAAVRVRRRRGARGAADAAAALLPRAVVHRRAGRRRSGSRARCSRCGST